MLVRSLAAVVRNLAQVTLLEHHEVRRLVRTGDDVTGAIVRLAETRGETLEALPLEAMQAIEPRITVEVAKVLSVEASVRSRSSYGGTAPQNVRKMARAWLRRLEKAAAAG